MVSRAVLSTILPLLLREEYPLFIYNGYRYVSIRPGYEPRPVGCLSVDPAFLADQHPNILGREPLRVTSDVGIYTVFPLLHDLKLRG